MLIRALALPHVQNCQTHRPRQDFVYSITLEVYVRSICIWDWNATSPYARQHDDSCGLCFYRKYNINFSLLVTCLADRFYGQPANSVPS
ncbi:hypothetical protein M405DRAFT_832917 [Rhizopogon salebrosus TDB-379]|nr:hypothetical protein M405DRAFT_832917 [Rhizopogon salebrosus TDB-379]